MVRNAVCCAEIASSPDGALGQYVMLRYPAIEIYVILKLSERNMKPELSIKILQVEAAKFAEIETIYDEPSLYGVTDGKAVGTYLEHKFITFLAQNYNYMQGNSALGIDIPILNVDIKVTSVKQPQSSCPFRSASQKFFGLDYHLLIFVYDKYDDHENRTGRLNMQHTIFVEKQRTADFQTTAGLLEILARNGNLDDIRLVAPE